MRLKKSSFWSKIPNWVWVLISLAVAIAIWLFAAYTWPLVFATPKAVVDAFISKAASGVLWGQSVPCAVRLCHRVCSIYPGGVPHGVV